MVFSSFCQVVSLWYSQTMRNLWLSISEVGYIFLLVSGCSKPFGQFFYMICLLPTILLFWVVFMAPHTLRAQSFAGQAALRPWGVTRIGEQPAALLFPEGETDWALGGLGIDWRSHLWYPNFKGQFRYAHARPGRTASQHSWIRIQGPSLSFAVHERAVIGIGVQYRWQVQMAVGADLAYDIVTEFSDVGTYKEKRKGLNGKLNSAQWDDLHMSYAYLLAENRRGQWYVGGSLHILAGNGAMEMHLPYMDYELRASNKITVNAYRWEARFSPGYAASEHWTAFWKPQGFGLGIDVGLQWHKKHPPLYKKKWHLEQVGLSVLDMGKIRFSPRSLYFHGIDEGLNKRIDLERLLEGLDGPVIIQDSLASSLGMSKRNESLSVSLPLRFRSEAMFVRENLSLFFAVEIDLHAWQHAEVGMAQPIKLSGVPVLELGRWGKVAWPQELDAVYGLQSGLAWMWKGLSLGITHWPALLAGEKGTSHAGLWLSWHKSFFTSNAILCP